MNKLVIIRCRFSAFLFFIFLIVIFFSWGIIVFKMPVQTWFEALLSLFISAFGIIISIFFFYYLIDMLFFKLEIDVVERKIIEYHFLNKIIEFQINDISKIKSIYSGYGSKFSFIFETTDVLGSFIKIKISRIHGYFPNFKIMGGNLNSFSPSLPINIDKFVKTLKIMIKKPIEVDNRLVNFLSPQLRKEIWGKTTHSFFTIIFVATIFYLALIIFSIIITEILK